MKKYILLTALAFAFQLNAQNANISGNTLPENAKNFIAQHFPDRTAVKTNSKTKNGISEHKVTFDNGDKIEFFGDGTWKEVKSKSGAALPNGIIPEKILKYVQSNYPNQKIVKIEKETHKYEVKLTNRLELEFDLDQNFLKID